VAHVRFFAAARAAAGTPTEDQPAESVADLLTCLTSRHGDGLARVLARSSVLVDGVVCHDHAEPLAAGATVDILPPFAGG
jgi:sulfur-carrier protein